MRVFCVLMVASKAPVQLGGRRPRAGPTVTGGSESPIRVTGIMSRPPSLLVGGVWKGGSGVGPGLAEAPTGLVESRRIALRRLAIRDSVKMRASAIWRFGDSVTPRIRGRAQRRSYAAQSTQATHLHYPTPSKHLELVGIADSCRHFAVQVNINKFLSCFRAELGEDFRLDLSMS